MSDYLTDKGDWKDSERAHAKRIKSAAEDFATAMFRHAAGHCLALIGQTTVGKTFMARKLFSWWNSTARFAGGEVWKHAPGEWIDWPNHSFEEVDEKARTSGLLVLDEVGRGRTSAVASASAIDRLVDLLSYRESHCQFTLVTANWSASDVPDRALLERFRRNGAVCIQATEEIRPFTQR